MSILVHPFVPVADDKSTRLILGSFPSVLSRQNDFYYGNPRNRFWQVLGGVLGDKAPDDIPGKTDYLLRHGIALWDVLASCRIRGSGDASIREATANDVPALLRRAPIRQIFCNGRTAGRYFTQYIEPVTNLQAVVLPSTSPANAAWRLEDLITAWCVIMTID
jgi:hypoxanthine-DNA glycosylase